MAIEDLLPALPADQREKAQELSEGYWDELGTLLDEHLPPTFPRPMSVFGLSEDDTGDDMEQGGVFVLFDEDDLYTKVEKPTMQAIFQATGKKPENHAWTIFG